MTPAQQQASAGEAPEWAKEKACDWHNRHVTVNGSKWRPDDISFPPAHAIDSLALYIAAHEQDPLIEQARRIAYETRRKRPGCAGYADNVCQKILAGKWDDHMLVQAALAGLRARVTVAKGGE